MILKGKLLHFALSLFFLWSCTPNHSLLLRSDSFTMAINDEGYIERLSGDRITENFLAEDTTAPLLSMPLFCL